MIRCLEKTQKSQILYVLNYSHVKNKWDYKGLEIFIKRY